MSYEGKMTDDLKKRLNEFFGTKDEQPADTTELANSVAVLKNELTNLLNASEESDAYTMSMMYYALAIVDLEHYLNHQSYASKDLTASDRHGRCLAVLRELLTQGH